MDNPMDIAAIVNTLVGGFVACMILCAIGVMVFIISRAGKGGGSKGSAKVQADETRLIQEIHQGLVKMESRIESLETLLLDEDRTKRARFNRELSED